MKKEPRPKKKKKRKKKRYLLKFTVFIAAAVGLYFLLSSSIFDTNVIIVENNQYYTTEQVIGLADAKTGENIFDASLGKMKQSLLEDPYIKNAKLHRKLPDKIVISVEERQESAAVLVGEQYILIDNEGMVLRKSETEPALTLLLGLTVKKIDPGAPLEVEENASLADTLRLLAAVETHEVYFKKIDISKVIVKAYIYDTLVCEGTPENLMNNLDYLQEVLYDLHTKGVERGVIKMGSGRNYSFGPWMEPQE